MSHGLGVHVPGWLQAPLASIRYDLAHGLVLECLVILVCICIVVVDVIEEEHAAALVALVGFLWRYNLFEGFLETLGRQL